jgi:serine/threonine-protein kinase
MAARDLASSSSSRGGPGAAGAAGPAPGGAPGLAGRYRSLFVIGRGGMGAVEAALELHSDGSEPTEQAAYERVVALKRLLPDAARDKRRVEMFLREAKLAKLLDHPNVVRAFDYGEIDGELFFAMEYVEGQPLSRVLNALRDGNGELGPSLTAHVLAEVCEGLHAAHELRGDDGEPLNLVHRDVSPQNVMLGYDGRVRLLDFGVAKIEAESVTKTGEVKGKTAYMSPEQAMGDAIDRRSDLFGVGAVLFECLALRRMWGDGTDMDVIRKLALEEPPPLEAAAAAAPEDMRALYTRLVARDAKMRPATAHDVAEELRKLVPQGREEAARALRRLLEAHFGEQAEEQRRRLTRALEEVAPEQARELRESVVPEPATPPSTRSIPRARSSMASVADATGANKALDSSVAVADEGGSEVKRERASKGVEAGAASARGAGPWVWVIAAASLIGGVGIWRASSGESAHVTPTPITTASAATASTASSLPATTSTPSASASASPSASASASAPASASASAPASASASASPSIAAHASGTSSARAPLPPVAARSASATTTPPATASARPPSTSNASAPASPPSSKPPSTTPPATAKPPPDVDDHPF